MTTFEKLPEDLPVPIDDNSCDHLVGGKLPPIEMMRHDGRKINLSEIGGRSVLYFYPMTGVPGEPLPDGWNEIPGARGCTPESCGFRDRVDEFGKLNATIFGISAQAPEQQLEAATRLRLPFTLLSDCDFRLTDSLQLPTFVVGGRKLIRRLTLIVVAGTIEKVFYPVFPPDRHAGEVYTLLQSDLNS